MGGISTSVITFQDGGIQRIYAFGYWGGNDHLYTNYWDGSQWKWADHGLPQSAQGLSLGEAITYLDPATRTRRIYAFFRGGNGHLYVNYWNGSQWKWADQGLPPGTTVGNGIMATTYLEGAIQRIYAFVIGGNDHLYVNYWDGFQWEWADQGTPSGTTVYAAGAVISYYEAGAHRIYAFVRGGNDHLYVNYWKGSQWKWADQGLPPDTTIGIPGDVITFEHAGLQRIYAFLGSNDVAHLYVNYWNGSQWTWVDLGASYPLFAKAVTYLDPATSIRRIYAFGSDPIGGHLHVKYWDGSQWKQADQGAPPGSTVGNVAGAITFQEAGTQRIYAFLTDGNSHLRVNYWNGSQWNWTDQGTPA